MIHQIFQNTEKIINRNTKTADFINLSPTEKTEARRLMLDLKKYSEHLCCYPQSLHETYLSEDDMEKMNKYYLWLESVMSCC